MKKFNLPKYSYGRFRENNQNRNAIQTIIIFIIAKLPHSGSSNVFQIFLSKLHVTNRLPSKTKFSSHEYSLTLPNLSYRTLTVP